MNENPGSVEKSEAERQLIAALESDEDHADMAVHDLLSLRASNINNGGAEAQADFLIENFGTAEDALQFIVQ